MLWAGIGDVLSDNYARGSAALEHVLAAEEMHFKPHDELMVRSLLAWAQQQSNQAGKSAAVLEEALQVADRARDQGWGLPELRAALGAVYLAMGRYDEAYAELEQAVSEGWREYWFVRNYPLLDAVQDRPEFRKLLGESRADVELMRQRLHASESDGEHGARAGRAATRTSTAKIDN